MSENTPSPAANSARPIGVTGAAAGRLLATLSPWVRRVLQRMQAPSAQPVSPSPLSQTYAQTERWASQANTRAERFASFQGELGAISPNLLEDFGERVMQRTTTNSLSALAAKYERRPRSDAETEADGDDDIATRLPLAGSAEANEPQPSASVPAATLPAFIAEVLRERSEAHLGTANPQKSATVQSQTFPSSPATGQSQNSSAVQRQSPTAPKPNSAQGPKPAKVAQRQNDAHRTTPITPPRLNEALQNAPRPTPRQVRRFSRIEEIDANSPARVAPIAPPVVPEASASADLAPLSAIDVAPERPHTASEQTQVIAFEQPVLSSVVDDDATRQTQLVMPNLNPPAEEAENPSVAQRTAEETLVALSLPSLAESSPVSPSPELRSHTSLPAMPPRPVQAQPQTTGNMPVHVDTDDTTHAEPNEAISASAQTTLHLTKPTEQIQPTAPAIPPIPDDVTPTTPPHILQQVATSKLIKTQPEPERGSIKHDTPLGDAQPPVMPSRTPTLPLAVQRKPVASASFTPPISPTPPTIPEPNVQTDAPSDVLPVDDGPFGIELSAHAENESGVIADKSPTTNQFQPNAMSAGAPAQEAGYAVSVNRPVVQRTPQRNFLRRRATSGPKAAAGALALNRPELPVAKLRMAQRALSHPRAVYDSNQQANLSATSELFRVLGTPNEASQFDTPPTPSERTYTTHTANAAQLVLQRQAGSSLASMAQNIVPNLVPLGDFGVDVASGALGETDLGADTTAAPIATQPAQEKTEPAAPAPPDMNALARQVYPILKRLLAVEREREHGR